MNRLTKLRGTIVGRVVSMLVLLTFAAVLSPGLPVFAQDAVPLDDALKQISTYEFGQSREMLSTVADMVKASYGDTVKRADVEQKLCALLGSDATYDCKDFVCRQLNIIGTEAAVPALIPLLTDERYSNMARYALEGIEGDAADQALATALGKTSGPIKVGIINSVGARRTATEVPALVKLMNDSDPDIAHSAVAALGHIGGPKAAKALDAARAGATPDLKQSIDDSYLQCAAQFLRNGQKDKALAIYSALDNPNESRQTRIAAIEGTVAVKGADALPMLIDLLKGENTELQAIAAGALRKLAGDGVTEAVAASLPNLTPSAQLVALYALRERADPAALSAVTAAADSTDPQVRLAALETLATVGDVSSVPLLARVATTAGDTEATHAAAASLDALRGDGVDNALAEMVKSGESPLRQEAIRSLAARGAVSAVPVLMTAAADPDDAVRQHAFDALGTLAGPDQLRMLTSLLVQMNGNSAQNAAESAVVAVSQKIEPAEQRAQTILHAMSTLKGKPEVRASFVHVLGRIGDPSALPALRQLAAQKKNGVVVDAAIRALADWPTAATMEDLYQLAATAPDDTLKTLAFRGYLRELRLPSDRPVEETLKLYERAEKLANTADDKRMVISGLAEIRDSRALVLVEPYLSDDDVKAEAAQAVEQIKENTK